MGKSPYPKELRDEVVAIARKREITVRQVARDFGITEATIYEWIKKADAEDGNGSPATNAASSGTELRAAKNRIRTLEQENEVLRRATAYFSQAVLPK